MENATYGENPENVDAQLTADSFQGCLTMFDSPFRASPIHITSHSIRMILRPIPSVKHALKPSVSASVHCH